MAGALPFADGKLLWRRPMSVAVLVLLLRALHVDATSGASAAADLSADGTADGAKATKKKRSRVRSDCAPELGLVTEKETSVTFARHALTFCNASSAWADKFSKIPEVLGIVAPWHDHSYRAARHFRRKLNSLSPLWFRVLPGRDSDNASAFEITGLQIADEQKVWKDKVTAGDLEMLPHFSIEGFQRLDSLRAILENPRQLVAEIAVMCDRGHFSGIVFDVRLALFRSLKPLVPKLIKELSQALHGAHRRLLLSVPAPLPGVTQGPGYFDVEDAAAVSSYVDGVIVGTRDFSRDEAGPSAPLPWVRASMKRLLMSGTNTAGMKPEQLLLEVPLYGRAFPEGQEGGRVILTNELAKALAKQKPKLIWDADSREHSANIIAKGARVSLAIPTLSFVAERLQLALDLGVGVALRDLGAGLDYAFDLLPQRHAGEDDFEDDAPAPAPQPATGGEL
eukprot:TRINITY_DN44832_c0_g1_i2.p1 TRINITY_DN44832_c0_g1~~TRINITY_DN44832_c0_g1_i2.p1  ORF type:complete len:452 (-),score=103.10 TRINITY_DN44832_c0_g1_i2:119-1474(-)